MQKLQSFIECLIRALVFGWGRALRGGGGGGGGGSISAFRGIFASAGRGARQWFYDFVRFS